jgi:hypothetical protein
VLTEKQSQRRNAQHSQRLAGIQAECIEVVMQRLSVPTDRRVSMAAKQQRADAARVR